MEKTLETNGILGHMCVCVNVKQFQDVFAVVAGLQTLARGKLGSCWYSIYVVYSTAMTATSTTANYYLLLLLLEVMERLSSEAGS